MPVVGNRTAPTAAARGYAKDPIKRYAAAFGQVATDMLHESGVDLFMEPYKALQINASNDALKRFFCEGAAEEIQDETEALGDSPEDVALATDDANLTMEAQYDNDREAILEYTNLAAFNPVIGMTFPIHKNILMNNIFDKGAIPKVVAKEPKFTISMETRILKTPDGEEIDMWTEQYKMREAIDATAPMVEVEVSLPSVEDVDLLTEIGADPEVDHLSVETHISAIYVSVYLQAGDTNPETGEEVEEDGTVECWIPVKVPFTVNYGEYDRALAQAVKWRTRDESDPDNYIIMDDCLTGYMQNDKVAITSMKGNVTSVKVAARVDTSSAMLDTCSVAWKVRTDLIEIPSAPPINVPISPEEVKDVGALYQVNQLSKILSLMKLALGNYKDDKIKMHLDESFMTMPDRAKNATTFDFAPRLGYALDHVEWRHKTFMDFLDSQVSCLLQVLNDPNMTISVFGSPELIRKITPTEYTYQTPSSIGPVDLDFTKTILTSDKRVYQFLASDKLRGNNNLIIILCPRNSERIVYRIYDYQMYVSNEIRNKRNYALPAIHAFERWKFVEYQPVQGRIKILNPTGLVDIKPNDDPIGHSEMNDFNMLFGN